jgi:hypothetical protein
MVLERGDDLRPHVVYAGRARCNEAGKAKGESMTIRTAIDQLNM